MNLHLYQRPAEGDAAIMDLTPYVNDWVDVTRAIGGYMTAGFSLSDSAGAGAARGRVPTLTRDQLTAFFETNLGHGITRSAFGMTGWQGLIYEMRLTVDGSEYTRTLAPEIFHNRVKLLYTDAIAGQTSLDWIENTDSSDQLGRMELLVVGGTLTSIAATATQARHLAACAWPRTRMSNELIALNGVRQRGIGLEVLCAGYWATLNWRYQETSTTGAADAQIRALAGASEFVEAGRIESNALSCMLDVEQSPQRLGDLIEDLIAQGDSDGGPWQGGVYAGRKLRYEPVPTEALYMWHNGMLQAIGGGEITPELIEPGCLIRNTSGLAAWRPVGQQQVWDDPLLAYVEAVEFSQREGIKLSLAKRSAEALTKQNSQSSQQLRTLTPLWVGHAEGPRAGLLQYGDDSGNAVYALEVVGPDNVPCFGISATDNGDPDAVQGGIGYETYPRIHFESVPGYARKLPLVDAALITGALPPGGVTVDAAAVTYTPAVAADWDADTDPGELDDALDQLAERVDDLEGAPPTPITSGNPFGYNSAVQLWLQSDNVDAGTYKLTFRGQETTAISKSILAVRPALEALSNVGAGNVFVDGWDDLPDRIVIYFTGVFAGEYIVTPEDIYISEQSFTYLDDPVTLSMAYWATGAAPDTSTPVTQMVFDTGSIAGAQILMLNLGTTEEPDWHQVNSWGVHDRNGTIQAEAHLTDREWKATYKQSGQELVVLLLDFSTGDLSLSFNNILGDAISYQVLNRPDAASVTYTPTTAADWDSDTDPGNVDAALDQLAGRVEDLEGAPPPDSGLIPLLAADPADPETGEVWVLKTPVMAGGALSGLLLALTATNIIGYVRQLTIYDGAPYRVTLEVD